MIINIDRFVNFLNENELSSDQFLILYLIYQGRIKLLQEYNYKQQESGNHGVRISDLERLHDYGYLYFAYAKDKNGEFFLIHNKYVPDLNSLILTESFNDELIIQNDDAAEELFESFPAITRLKNIVVKRSDGGDVEKAMDWYRKYINNDRIKHQEIVKRLKTAIEYGYLESGFPKWVFGRMWEDPRISDTPNDTSHNEDVA